MVDLINFIPEFSSSKIIEHRSHSENKRVELGIGYDMIIFYDLMVKLDLLADYQRQLLQWDGITVPMKEPIGLLGKSYLTNRNMHELVMQTAEPVSTIEATERLVKILNSTFSKSDLKQVANNATQMNAVKNSTTKAPQIFQIIV